MKWFVVGIASWGGNCDPEASPTVYTAVFSYLDWIQKATAQEGKPFIPEGADDIGPYSQVFIPDSASGSPLFSMTCAIAPVLLLMDPVYWTEQLLFIVKFWYCILICPQSSTILMRWAKIPVLPEGWWEPVYLIFLESKYWKRLLEAVITLSRGSSDYYTCIINSF